MIDVYNPLDWWSCCNMDLAIWLSPYCPCCGKEYPGLEDWLKN